MSANSDPNSKTDNLANEDCRPVPCSSFCYGVGAFFVAPVAAIFCVLMGLMLILAWPFIPFLCYMQRKEEISKANEKAQATLPKTQQRKDQ